MNDLRFRHPWRPYQRRALDAFDEHLADQHFHIVAAPGSGKTCLGLEAVRRLGHPALVLAPTLTIREQWLHRFSHDFLTPEGTAPPETLLSRELTRPARLTVSTYQSLVAALRDGDPAVAITRLVDHGIRTVVVDEAHHLRRHWWDCLRQLKEAIPSPFVVALTATPPYDVGRSEWDRYASFCGPVDAEIGIPELVLEKNLCPHHDFVYLTTPTNAEVASLERFRARVRTIVNDLATDTGFASAALAHPPLATPQPADAVVARFQFYFAALVFLEQVGGRRPAWIEEVFGVAGRDLPDLDDALVTAFLNPLLFDRDLAPPEDSPLTAALAPYRSRLTHAGAIEHRKVDLTGSRRLGRQLRRSASKVDAAAEIVAHEAEVLGPLLRAVVLTDHVRAAALKPGRFGDGGRAPKLGVVPLFDALRRRRLPGLSPAVLTGGLVVIPAPVLPLLTPLLGSAPAVTQLPHLDGFLSIAVTDTTRRGLVAALTALFTDGHINVIFGTTALLGEGWDAPALNTLVLASSVGAYVTSNQVRGRAIRVWDKDPDKTANIWHLACLDPGSDGGPGEDFVTLSRRFDGYAGLRRDTTPPVVAEGFARLGIPEAPGAAEIAALNARTLASARDRPSVARDWLLALPTQGTERFRPVTQVTIPVSDTKPPPPDIVTTLPFTFPASTPAEPRGLQMVLDVSRSPIVQWWRRRKLRRQLRAQANAVLASLGRLGLVPGFLRLTPVTVSVRDGAATVTFRELPIEHQRLASETFAALFDVYPFSPYLLLHRGTVYSVPANLSRSRTTLDNFLYDWHRYVGRPHLLRIRNEAASRKVLELLAEGSIRLANSSPVPTVRWLANPA